MLTEHVHYVYDVFDHLIATEVDPTGGGTYTEIQHYVLDVSPEIPAAGVPGTATAPPVFVFDGSGNLIGRNLVALNAAGVDAVVAQRAVTSLTQSDTVDWDLTDNLGSLRIVLDNASNVIDQIIYNSVGQVAYESDPSAAHFTGFEGGHVDADGGVRTMDLFRPPDASVGGLPLAGVSEVHYIDLARMRDGSGMDVFGYIGLDFLRHRVVRIDFDRGEITFLKSLPDKPGAPFILDLSSPNVPPKILAHIAGVGEQWFMIDTGYTAVGSLDARLLARVVKDGSAAPVSSVMAESIAKSSTVRRLRLRDVFALGGFRHRGLIFEEGPENILGCGYLERYLVTFDFPAKRMYLKRGDLFDKPSLSNLSGAEPWCPEGLMTVRVVAPNSPADTAGLKVGDIVEEIDGRRVASLTSRQAWRPVCHPGRHTIRVRRGEQRLAITLLLSEPREDVTAAPAGATQPTEPGGKSGKLDQARRDAEITDRNAPATALRRAKLGGILKGDGAGRELKPGQGQ